MIILIKCTISYQIPKIFFPKICEIFNFITGIEKKLTNLLKELKASETISENDYKKLKPRGSGFGVLYGLCKTHKKVLDKCPLFRPTLLAIKTPLLQFSRIFSSPQ